MTSCPRVTVIIPVRDEAERLSACLDAVANQDMAPELVEVLVVDGGSADDTVAKAERLLAGRGWAQAEVLHCSPGDRSSNLNCGLDRASAPVVVRVDARSRVPSHYLRRCLELLDERTDVAVVGGRQRAVAASSRAVDVGVARALNNRWAMGLARYRRSAASGETDTVYLGAYRTDQLRRVGGWRTELKVNEDFDLNRRLRRFGAVWFDADLIVDYAPRASFGGLARQYWSFGTGKAGYWRLSGDRPRPRQVLLLVSPAVGVALLGAVSVELGTRTAAVLMACGAAVALLVEVLGSDGPSGGPSAHLVSLSALGCVAGAWLVGVAVGALWPVAPSADSRRPVGQAA